MFIVEERWDGWSNWHPVLNEPETDPLEFTTVADAEAYCKRQKTIFRIADPDFRIVEIQRRVIVPDAGR